MSKADSKGKFRIQTVAEMTGVPASTLRSWEQRYGFPTPDRTASAYRVYSEADIAEIARVRELCDGGLAPAEAVAQVLEDEAGPTPTAVAPNAAVTRVVSAGDVDAAVSAIAAFDPGAAHAAVRAALLVGSHAEAFTSVIAPAWQRVRAQWLQGELGRHHERLAAEIFGQAARDMLRLGQPPAPAPWAVVACFADEDDTAPAFAAALTLQSRGHRVQVLGARTRPKVLRGAADALDAAVVGLSLSESLSARGARELVEDYAAAIGSRSWFVIGDGTDSVATLVESSGGRIVGDPAEIATAKI